MAIDEGTRMQARPASMSTADSTRSRALRTRENSLSIGFESDSLYVCDARSSLPPGTGGAGLDFQLFEGHMSRTRLITPVRVSGIPLCLSVEMISSRGTDPNVFVQSIVIATLLRDYLHLTPSQEGFCGINQLLHCFQAVRYQYYIVCVCLRLYLNFLPLDPSDDPLLFIILS